MQAPMQAERVVMLMSPNSTASGSANASRIRQQWRRRGKSGRPRSSQLRVETAVVVFRPAVRECGTLVASISFGTHWGVAYSAMNVHICNRLEKIISVIRIQSNAVKECSCSPKREGHFVMASQAVHETQAVLCSALHQCCAASKA